MESLAGISQKSPPGFGVLAAPVSARLFSISVLRRPRLVRITTETGSLNALGYMQPDALLLCGPRVLQRPGKTANGKVCRRRTLDNRCNNARRHERERGEEPDVPFPQRFTLGNFCEGICATNPKVFDPSPRLGHGIKQSLASMRVHFRSSGRRMNDALDDDITWGRPRQLDGGGSWQVGGSVSWVSAV